MDLKITKNDATVTICVLGRIDTTTALTLGDAFQQNLTDDVKELELDLADCDYIASSGLRVILQAQKTMNGKQGSMVVKNVIGDVMEVFDMTGFADILTFA